MSLSREEIMPIRLDDYVAKLPEERQHAIKKRTAELIAEEATLRQIRESLSPEWGQEHQS
jgi:hypothetical protein